MVFGECGIGLGEFYYDECGVYGVVERLVGEGVVGDG